MHQKNTTIIAGIFSVCLAIVPVSATAVEKTDLSFQAAFPKPIYRKSYFPFVIMGTTAVAAGVLTFATGGAGAPAAATGVSTVASWVGGGGAGSYMAGLSTVGSWVGGNAMTGAAILNGASIGLGGGSAAFANLGMLGKASALTSMSATALDGVMFFQNEQQKVIVDVRLEVPIALASGAVEKLASELDENTDALAKASKKDQKSMTELTSARTLIKNRIERLATRWQNRKRVDIGNTVVLGVLAKNVGLHDLGNNLIFRIPSNYLSRRGYYYYLLGVISLQNGRSDSSKKYLERARKSENYAIEPTILYTSLLANEDFAKNRIFIHNMGIRFGKLFDSDKYTTPYGLSALYYRIGSIHLTAKYYKNAETWFRKSEDELSWLQTSIGDQTIHNLVRLGIANSLCGQAKRKEANAIMAKIKEDGGIPSATPANLSCPRA